MVSGVDAMDLLDLGQHADHGSIVVSVRCADQLDAGADVRGLRCGHQADVGPGLDDRPVPSRSSAVDELESIPRLAAFQPSGIVDRHDADRMRRRGVGAVGREPHECGLDDVSETVTSWRDPHDTRTRMERAGTQLRAGEVHRYARSVPIRTPCRAHVVDHPRPRLGAVVRAVDAGDVHTAGRHLHDEIGVVAGRGRERDHDPRAPRSGGCAQQCVGVGGQESASLAERDAGGAWWWLVAVEPGEHGEDLLDRREDVRLGPAERGQPDGGETRLQIANIVLAKLEVVDQVRSRTSMRRMCRCDVAGSCRLRDQHRIAHRADIRREGFELATRTVDGVHDIRLRSPDEHELNTS